MKVRLVKIQRRSKTNLIKFWVNQKKIKEIKNAKIEKKLDRKSSILRGR